MNAQPTPPRSDEEPFKTPELQACAKHPQVETRLTCTHCETPICPKCMVVCEVGMKCRKCTAKSSSHVVQAEARDFLFSGALAAALGFGAGYILYATGGVSWWMLFIAFGAGNFCGQLVHRCARYKLATPLIWSTVGCTLLGMALSPLGQTLLLLVNVPDAMGYGSIMPLISAGAFLSGIYANFQIFRR